ncbi:hypothetical protein NE686_04150 [Tissierella carlieri]|uniref:Uncharacterized protein n=1 Tax=Tissierella carlieri TaxID=689904 RepID=A0ABT1S717_9FIRM|nr:hypothetical protein [Tissierella carlieri]MCQ4922264.1 hypothetical protein [Tissierella carlieri]
MREILQVLNDFQGIIGAILGSATTLIVTDMLKKRGQLKIYLITYKDKFQTFKDVGCSMGNKEDEDFYGYSVKYVIQVYNKSDTPKIMRDFKFVFFKNKKEIYSIVPDNEDTRRYSSYTTNINEMEISNIAPKEIQVLKQSIYIMYEVLDRIEGSDRIELQYRDEKDKKRKVTLSKKVVTKNDYVSE